VTIVLSEEISVVGVSLSPFFSDFLVFLEEIVKSFFIQSSPIG
jgi:hypothetical protein